MHFLVDESEMASDFPAAIYYFRLCSYFERESLVGVAVGVGGREVVWAQKPRNEAKHECSFCSAPKRSKIELYAERKFSTQPTQTKRVQVNW